MKILYVAIYPSPGMVPFACSIINSMSNAGHCIYFMSVSDSNLSYKKNINSGVNQIDLTYPSSLLGKFHHHFICKQYYSQISQIIKNIDIEIVHFLTGEYGFALWYTKKLVRKTTLVYTVHDLEQHPSKGNSLKEKFYNFYFHLMTRKNAKLINHLCTCSNEQVQKLKLMFPNKVIGYHHFPSLVTEDMKYGIDVCPELIGESGYILFWGVFSYYKGVETLYRAYLESSIRHKKKLVLAGMGEYYFTRADDEYGIIRINRFIKDTEVGSLFKNASFIVYPYIQATMSGVLSVAHYFKKRVVVSDVPFFIDNKNSNDVVFPHGDVISLRRVIEELSLQDSILNLIIDNKIDISDELYAYYQKCTNLN